MPLIDRFLYYYSTLFAIIITLGALFSGFALNNLLGTVLFLPVSLTLTYELICNLHHARLSRLQGSYPNRYGRRSKAKTTPISPFDFRFFFAQRSPLFLATLTLFVITLTISVLRAGLTFLPQPELLSPIPTTQLTINK